MARLAHPFLVARGYECFYEKVIKVKAHVAALLIFFDIAMTPLGVESCQGRARMGTFILTLLVAN